MSLIDKLKYRAWNEPAEMDRPDEDLLDAVSQLEAMQAVLTNVEATLKRTDMTERARLAVIEQFVTARASLDSQGK